MRVRELTGTAKDTILKRAKNHNESRDPLSEGSLACVSRRGESGRKRKLRSNRIIWPEIRELWQKVRMETGWGGAPSIRRLFGSEKNVKAILGFLEKTKMGKMPSRVLLAGGPDLEEEEMEGFSLRVPDETGTGSEVSSSGEEDGPGPPL